MLEHYAPPVKIDHQGSQLHWIWHFVRDVYLFWPWYKPDAAHARRVGLPGADELHDKVVEVLKAARTYHLSYRAAIAYDKEPRLPLVNCTYSGAVPFAAVPSWLKLQRLKVPPSPMPDMPHRSASVVVDHVSVTAVNGSCTSQRRP